jgi:hypothetical protein
VAKEKQNSKVPKESKVAKEMKEIILRKSWKRWQ